MSGMWKRSHGRTSEAPPDERGGYRYVRPTATAPHLDSTHPTADFCAAFGVSESTVHAKARVIEKTLRIGGFDPKSALPSLLGSNPLVWMAEVNGLLVDLRTMPREVQEVAFAKGIIPYIPADGQDQS